ncbi:MAG: O-antigen ligase family protein [Salinisphaera sp.]|nr:O-antigen ligase family protein [Salinisphaera sp.]
MVGGWLACYQLVALADLQRTVWYPAMAALVVLVMSAVIAGGGLRMPKPGKPTLAITLFVVSMLLSVAWGAVVTLASASMEVGALCFYFIVLCLLVALTNRSGLAWFKAFLVTVPLVGFAGTVVVYAVFGGFEAAQAWSGSAAFLGDNPFDVSDGITIGTCSAVCIPFLFSESVASRSFVGLRRRSAMFLLGVACLNCTLSASRGAVLSVAVAALAFLVLVGLRGKIPKPVANAVALGVMGLILVGFALYQIPAVTREADEVAGEIVSSALLGSGQVDLSRVLLFEATWRAIKQYPLTGLGFGGMRDYYESLHGYPKMSHSIVTTAWAEGGVLGAISLLVAIFWLFRTTALALRGNRADSARYLFFCALCSSLIATLLQAGFTPLRSKPVFWVLLALLCTRMVRTRIVFRAQNTAGTHHPLTPSGQ